MNIVVVGDASLKRAIQVARIIARRLASFLRFLGIIEVYVISGRRMRALNKKFRGIDSSTNVLSFRVPVDFPGDILGEVYLDPAYIKQHDENIGIMLVHGVLHILGYDHRKKNDRIKMEQKEKQLLGKLCLKNILRAFSAFMC